MPGTSWSMKTEKGTASSDIGPRDSQPPPPPPQALPPSIAIAPASTRGENETTRLRKSRIEEYTKDSGFLPNLMRYTCVSSSSSPTSSSVDVNRGRDGVEGGPSGNPATASAVIEGRQKGGVDGQEEGAGETPRADSPTIRTRNDDPVAINSVYVFRESADEVGSDENWVREFLEVTDAVLTEAAE